MPELPEVEIQARLLTRRLRGERIRAVEVRDVKISLRHSLVGRRIRRIWRRAKLLVFDFDADLHLLVHLRMTGWWEFVQPPRYRCALVAGSATAYFADSRRFGTVVTVTTAELHRLLAPLGPEPLRNGCDLTRLQRTTRAIKPALLDQHLIAGVGNIYANEALWRARIHPCRTAHRLTPADWRRLRRGLQAALRQGLAYGPRIFEVQTFHVYERAGKPCPRCRTAIRRILLAQRSTFFCPQCQPQRKTR